MGDHIREDLSPDQLLNSFACLEPSSIQEMERGEGELVNLDYQELYRSPHLSSYTSTTSLPTMAESGLTDYISYYSAMELASSCGINLSKPTFQSEQGNSQSTDLGFRSMEHPQTDSIDFSDNEVSQNKEIISSSLRNIQDAIVTTNISASSRGLIEKSLHILRTAIAIGSQEEETEEVVNLEGMQAREFDGLEAVGGLPASALAVDEEAVREALGLHNNKVGAPHSLFNLWRSQKSNHLVKCLTSHHIMFLDGSHFFNVYNRKFPLTM